MTIKLRLMLGFSFTTLVFGIVMLYAITKMESLSDQTKLIYDHPLQVTNAVLRINTAIVKIHRNMKDIVLAKDNIGNEFLVAKIVRLESDIYRDFNIIKDNFLGKKETYLKAIRLVRDWEPIRKNVIRFYTEKQVDKAIDITRNKGARHVEMIEDAMHSLELFAQEKARTFLTTSVDVKNRAFNVIYFVFIITLFLIIVLAFILVKSIVVPLEVIEKGIVHIGSGNLGYKIDTYGDNEISKLGNAFNKMTADLQRVIISRDKLDIEVIERTRVERELLKARNEAEVANKAKSTFMANMCHEIRTPMNSILGFSQMLNTELTDDEKNNYIRLIQQGGDNLMQIVTDMLDISLLESGKLQLNTKKIDLGSILSGVISFLAPTVHQNVSVDLKIIENIMDVYYGDDLRLRQIFLNILGNAIKFTDNGNILVRVCEYESYDDYAVVEFVVEDSGRGIKKDFLERVFLPYTQEDEAITRQYGGIGLGLTIAKELAIAMDGGINISSEYKKGTIVKAYMKLMRNEEVRGKDLSTVSNYGDRKVLIVEDDYLNKLFISKLLSRYSINFDIAENGIEAEELACSNDYDLILMDLQLPKQDGNQTAINIRNRGVMSPIVAISAHIFEHDKEKAFESGMVDFITKPIDTSELDEVLSKYLA